MPRITLENVQMNYGNGADNAVKDLSLEIGDGEFMCLLGPSGCGKTTTLRMIAGLEHPTGGRIRVGDRTMDSVDEGIYVPPEKRGMGLVFQSYALWPHLTVEENVSFGLRIRKVGKAERGRRTGEVMEALGLVGYRSRYPSQLSGGQQQRVALARMLAVNPNVLLLDEPLSNLDARLRLEMRAELKRIHEEFNTTVVFVTHDQWEAMTLASTIAVMNHGELQQVGSPDEVYSRPANRFVAEFVGNAPINIVTLSEDEGEPISALLRSYLSERFSLTSATGSVGVRPEAVHLARSEREVPAGAFRAQARVTSVLPTGGSWIVEMTVLSRSLFMITSDLPQSTAGDEVILWVGAKDLHHFEPDGRSSADLVLEPAS